MRRVSRTWRTVKRDASHHNDADVLILRLLRRWVASDANAEFFESVEIFEDSRDVA